MRGWVAFVSESFFIVVGIGLVSILSGEFPSVLSVACIVMVVVLVFAFVLGSMVGSSLLDVVVLFLSRDLLVSFFFFLFFFFFDFNFFPFNVFDFVVCAVPVVGGFDVHVDEHGLTVQCLEDISPNASPLYHPLNLSLADDFSPFFFC